MLRRFAGHQATRMLRRRFAGVRLLRGDAASLEAAARHDGPLILAMSHSAWWDPVVGAWLYHRYLSDRTPMTLIEAQQLRRLKMLRILSFVGVEPGAPDALARLRSAAGLHFAHTDRPLLAITPQGTFADPRAPLRLRPGAAAVAADHPGARVLVLAAEYPMGLDPKPQVMLAIGETQRPERPTLAGWHRAIHRQMRRTTHRLAEAVISRELDRFETMMGGGGSVHHPVYDLWLRLTGRRVALHDDRAAGKLAAGGAG
jgi:1-acyl-sn-glycerol-3-phosphate acyltransferase